MTRVFQLLLSAALLLPLPVLATQQERDAIKFPDGAGFLVECPLNAYLRALNPIPTFDVQRTSNYKGYAAAWEIRDSQLYLVSFSAVSGSAPVSAAALFPSRTLPILADWFSGPLHITSGKVTRAQGYLTFERVTRCRVSKGIITSTEELRNAREDQLQKQ